MSDDEFIISCGFFLLQDLINRRKRRYWVNSLLKRRCDYSTEQLLCDLRTDDVGLNGELRSSFQNFTRMSSSDFELLVNLVGPTIGKENTNYRNSISVACRLALTLRYLATGDSFQSLKYLFKVSTSAISGIIPEVCDALYHSLQHYIKVPTDPNEWKKIAHDYNALWNFPMCIGSMDGKHVVLISPKFSGSEFFNYKGTLSIVLFAVVDANYKFIYVHVGTQGRISDGGVFKSTAFAKTMENMGLNLPPESHLPGRVALMPHVIVADDAFPLTETIMKPFPGHQLRGSDQRIYNYRLSRARRVVENVFGILASVFRVLRKPMHLEPPKAEKIVIACTCLHNFLRRNSQSKNIYCPPGTFDLEDLETRIVTDGAWRKDAEPLESFLPIRRTARKSAVRPIEIRNEFSEYFSSEIGQVSRQNDYQ